MQLRKLVFSLVLVHQFDISILKVTAHHNFGRTLIIHEGSCPLFDENFSTSSLSVPFSYTPLFSCLLLFQRQLIQDRRIQSVSLKYRRNIKKKVEEQEKPMRIYCASEWLGIASVSG